MYTFRGLSQPHTMSRIITILTTARHETRELKGQNRKMYDQLPLLIRSPNKTFLGSQGVPGCPRVIKVDEVKP